MFKPKIICFVCNWGLPTGVDLTSPKEHQGYPKVHVIRVMCVGRIDPVVILETFSQGADGVLMVGCPSPDCHYLAGNLQTEQKVKVLKKLISLTGLQSERLRLEWVYATDVGPFAKIVDEFRSQIIKLGQSPLAGKSPSENIEMNISAAGNAAADFRLRVLMGREEELTEAKNVYGEIIPKAEFDDLLDEVVEEEFIRHKLHCLAKQKPSSVKELAIATDLKPISILRHIVDMRRKGMIALDHIEQTTPLYKALEVQ